MGKIARPAFEVLRVILSLILVASCTQERGVHTAIAVSVMYDPALSLSRISYQVFASQADPESDRALAAYSAQGASLDRPYAIERREQPVILLVVRGYGADSASTPIVEHRLRAAFVEGKMLALHVYLSRSCASKVCDEQPGQTCFGEGRDGVLAGTCGPIPGPYSLDAITSLDKGDDWIPSATGAIDPIDSRMLGGGLDASVDAAPAPGDPDTGHDREAGPCPITDGAICNPVARCGCAAGQHCQARGDQLLCAPIPSNGVKEGAACAASSECAEGLSCWYGVCRRHCFGPDDCGKDDCYLGETGFGACHQRCGEESDLPCEPGVSCVPLRLRRLMGRYCAVPKAPCPHLEDGECDEPTTGTGVCAAGSDGSDCCAAADGGTCDLIRQCGCGAQANCTVGTPSDAPTTLTIACIAPGPRGRGETCDAENACQRGYGCLGGVCRNFCQNDTDCGDGICIAANNNGAEVMGAKVCLHKCDFVSGVPCAAGTVCARYPQGDYCTRQGATCAGSGNGTCDETTRICAPGTDTDCPH